MLWPWLLAGLLAVLAAFMAWAWLRPSRGDTILRAREQFTRQRKQLEADFLRAASATGKPRGLLWKACDWEPEVVLARDRRTGSLNALVGVTIQFEAIPGSDMEGLPAVGNLRNASGVFFYEKGRWQTGGRAVFNFNPEEAIEHFKGQYEKVG